MADAKGSSGASCGDFEIFAKAARVEIDLNSRDARLSRLADDPLLLREALAEKQETERRQVGPALAPAASGALAMIISEDQTDCSDHAEANRHYTVSEMAEWSFGRVEYYNLSEDNADQPAPPVLGELIQFAILALSTFAFLALTAFLLFAA